MDAIKKYYSSPNLELPSELNITNDIQNELHEIKFNCEYKTASLDNEIREINVLYDHCKSLDDNVSMSDNICKNYCECLVNFLLKGTDLLLKFNENNINFWMLSTKIIKTPIKIYYTLFKYEDLSCCLSKESIHKLAEQFGNWINALKNNTLIHIYKYSYYLLISKLFGCMDGLPIIEQNTTHMLEEFVIDCNKTQIYNREIINDIDVIKNGIIKLKPMWFSDNSEYLELLNVLYKSILNNLKADLIQSRLDEINGKNNNYVTSDVIFEYFNFNDVLKNGSIKSNFNLEYEDIKKDVKFENRSINLNNHKIMADYTCSVFYFPDLSNINFNEPTCISILLQMIYVCRLENIKQHNYPRGFGCDCSLAPTKQDYNMNTEYFMYKVDNIKVYKRTPTEYIDTSINISGMSSLEQNQDAFYNFIKYLQTNDSEYLKHIFCFIKYGYSLDFKFDDKSLHNIDSHLKYSNENKELVLSENYFSNNSLYVNNNQLNLIYNVFENENQFIAEIDKKIGRASCRERVSSPV